VIESEVNTVGDKPLSGYVQGLDVVFNVVKKGALLLAMFSGLILFLSVLMWLTGISVFQF